MLVDRKIEYRRLRAPREDGQTLIDPPRSAVGAMLDRNAARGATYDYDLQGQPLVELARQARRDMLERAVRYTAQYRDTSFADTWLASPAPRVLLSGHQPQLFHPGVWYKNFVLGPLAEEHQAAAVNLVIDSDTIKIASIRVPSGTVEQPIVETVQFDRLTDEIPFEERRVVDETCFRTFGQRTHAAIESLVSDPLVNELWPLAVERLAEERNLGLCLAQARHLLEARWGLLTLELPQSELCRLPAFYWFTAHLLAQLPRFWEVYNSTLAEYRQVHRLRSKAQPVPDLASDGAWLEAPFWIWTQENPRRRRVFVCQRDGQIVLSDREGVDVALDLMPDASAERAVEQLAQLESHGIKLRTRALTTTMFSRLLLSELFLHGIGGAKYDQLTDKIIWQFFGLEPPEFLTVTATMRLPIARQPVTPDAVRQIDHTLRELTYHPERHLDLEQVPEADRPQVMQLIERKRHWIATPKTHENAHARHVAITEANEALQPWLAPLRAELLTRRRAMEQRLRAEAILASREYAFCLFPERSLRTQLQALS